MSDFERPDVTFDQPEKRRSAGSWFGDLSDRITRSFKDFDRPKPDDQTAWPQEEPAAWEPYQELDDVNDTQATSTWEAPGRRFPTALHGYDRDAVDQHLAALERELDQLRIQRAPTAGVQAEIQRLGEQTSAIIKVAHEQAMEITRRAQVQADKCVADAAANAVAMTEGATRKLRQLDVETDAVWAERARLLDDTRNVATALLGLVDEATERFPEDKGATQPSPPAIVASPPASTAPPGSGAPPPASAASAAVSAAPLPPPTSVPPVSTPYLVQADEASNREDPGDLAG